MSPSSMKDNPFGIETEGTGPHLFGPDDYREWLEAQIRSAVRAVLEEVLEPRVGHRPPVAVRPGPGRGALAIAWDASVPVIGRIPLARPARCAGQGRTPGWACRIVERAGLRLKPGTLPASRHAWRRFR